MLLKALAFSSASKLRQLDLRSNQLRSLDLFPLLLVEPPCPLYEESFELQLAGNKDLKNPPLQSVDTPEKFQAYFRDLQKGGAQLDTVRIMMLGHGGAGTD
jgi:hypothetical protein